jgi:hypothetical protein
MDDRITPTSLDLTSAHVAPPPPPPDSGALVAQTSDAESGGSIKIECDELVVKGERPKPTKPS